MTQEHPQRLCFDCRTPLSDPAATIAGEHYCADCAPDAVRRQFG